MSAEKVYKPLAPLMERELQRAEFATPQYRMIVDDNMTVEHLLKPETWVNIGHRLGQDKPFPEITVVWQDGSRYVRLLILAAAAGYAKAVVLENTDLTKHTAEVEQLVEGAGSSPDFEIKHKGSIDKWCVIRKADQEKIVKGLGTKDEASRALAEHLKNIA